MRHETINEYIADVMNGTMTATDAAADMFPNMNYAVSYYSPARGEWDAYQAIVSEYKKLSNPPAIEPENLDADEFDGFNTGKIITPFATDADRNAYGTMVKCSCGHTTLKHLVMSASTGSSCPHCYDKMSD